MTDDPATATAPRPFLDPQQLAIDGLGPVLGGRYRHRRTGTLAVVVSHHRKRFDWVTVRVHGSEQTLKASTFLRTYQPD